MRARVLRHIARKVLHEAIHVLRRRHEQIDSLEPALRLSVVGDRLNLCISPSSNARQERGGMRRTRHILLEDVKLLEHRAQQLLRVRVHDQDLPSCRWLHGADRLEELCSMSSAL